MHNVPLNEHKYLFHVINTTNLSVAGEIQNVVNYTKCLRRIIFVNILRINKDPNIMFYFSNFFNVSRRREGILIYEVCMY